jgi:16S rRNA (cytosine1402-N4)-methyltransferase
MMYHIPVLLDESVGGLNIRPDGTYVDVTLGSGGHSERILQELTTGRLIAFDRDRDSSANVITDSRFTFIRQNYRYLRNFLTFNGISKIDGLLADLGISSHQIDKPERGFSTRYDGDLDMRMDQDQDVTAGQIVNTYKETALTEMFREYGELDEARKIAADIIAARLHKPITTSLELKNILLRRAPRNKENQFLAKAYQAIRIEVNEELDSLKDMLTQACDMMYPGGRIVVISYHSLEDRIVKNYFRTGRFDGVAEKDFFGRLVTPLKAVTRKAIVPGDEEIAANPRSRSAKLRIAEKI